MSFNAIFRSRDFNKKCRYFMALFSLYATAIFLPSIKIIQVHLILFPWYLFSERIMPGPSRSQEPSTGDVSENHERKRFILSRNIWSQSYFRLGTNYQIIVWRRWKRGNKFEVMRLLWIYIKNINVRALHAIFQHLIQVARWTTVVLFDLCKSDYKSRKVRCVYDRGRVTWYR